MPLFHPTARIIPSLYSIQFRDFDVPGIIHSFTFDQVYTYVLHDRLLRRHQFDPNRDTIPGGYELFRTFWEHGDPNGQCDYRWAYWNVERKRPYIPNRGKQIEIADLLPGFDEDDAMWTDPSERRRLLRLVRQAALMKTELDMEEHRRNENRKRVKTAERANHDYDAASGSSRAPGPSYSRAPSVAPSRNSYSRGNTAAPEGDTRDDDYNPRGGSTTEANPSTPLDDDPMSDPEGAPNTAEAGASSTDGKATVPSS
ncbi:hypothetical protein K474DRAFT_1661687 [Panus rudis PR-1116 ss-1]|nr:hypothetical protein K474DRAFT_1661687 [Panus rudis PR-1116 ss-1]